MQKIYRIKSNNPFSTYIDEDDSRINQSARNFKKKGSTYTIKKRASRSSSENSSQSKSNDRSNSPKKSPRSRSKSKENKVKSNVFDRFNMPSQEEQLDKLASTIDILLQENYGRMKYSCTKDKTENKNINHWGQRKLFMSELWFLTHYGDLASTVVYAGAAPSTHTTYLMTLFPKHHFILVDPNKFELKQLDPMPSNYEIINGYFTDSLACELALKYPGNILFISDIRTADKDTQIDNEVEQFVRNDNIKQMDWINIMKPKKSILKFRCPYPSVKAGEKNLKMFKGQIFLQPWAPPKSTETRLVPDDSLEMIEYDNLKYEEQLYYHNMEMRRNKRFKQPISFGEGFDDKWDICAEILIIKQFFDRFPDFLDAAGYKELNLYQKIVKFSEDLSRFISLGKRNLTSKVHGKNPYFTPFDNRGFYMKEKVATTLQSYEMDHYQADW